MLISLDKQRRRHGVRPRHVLHIGAHLGEEAVQYEAAGVESCVWVEANPALIPALTEAVAPYGHTVISAAVSSPDKAGTEGMLHLADNGQSSSLLEPGTHLVHHDYVHFQGLTPVTLTTIDALQAEHGFRPDYMSLDIQGAEVDALKGAEETLRSVRWVYSEINTEEVYVGCGLLPEMDDWLGERGFDRIAIRMAGDVGWGDALFSRRR